MAAIAEALREKLMKAFSPTRLDIIDDSARHAGHAGARPGGESHFTIVIECAAFAGLGRVARQRLVHDVLALELRGPVHALCLTAIASGVP